jgi:hypothetical protein
MLNCGGLQQERLRQLEYGGVHWYAWLADFWMVINCTAW